RGGEGLDPRRRGVADRLGLRRPRGRGAVAGGLADSHHARRDHLGAHRGGHPGQPGGRRAGQVRRTARAERAVDHSAPGTTLVQGTRPATVARHVRRGRHGDGGHMRFDSIERAVADIAAGKAVVVVDDEDRENEGDLIFAAEKVTPELMAFMIRHSSGYVCVPMTGEDCDRLGLPPMFARNQDRLGTAYTVTVDAREGVTTGISATDRARTVALLADPA